MRYFKFKGCATTPGGGEEHFEVCFGVESRSRAIARARSICESMIESSDNPDVFVSCFTLFELREGLSGEYQYSPHGMISIKPESKLDLMQILVSCAVAPIQGGGKVMS